MPDPIRYSNILTLVESGSESLDAVRCALLLARQSGGSVTATRVIDLPPRTSGGEWASSGWDVFRAEVLGQEMTKLSSTLERISENHPRLHGKVVLGKAPHELIQLVLERDHDLVIKLAAGAEGGRRVAFGSTGLHLVRKSPAPVWLLPRTTHSVRRVLAAVNPGRPGEDEHYALCERVLAHAATLAKALNAELHVAHVHELPEQISDTALGRKLWQHLEAMDQRVQSRLREAITGIDLDVTIHTLRGAPQQLLPELTRTLAVHTLVMGSVGRSDVPGLLIGDLAEEVLLRVDCGVFCIKPPGFASPMARRAPAAALRHVG